MNCIFPNVSSKGRLLSKKFAIEVKKLAAPGLTRGWYLEKLLYYTGTNLQNIVELKCIKTWCTIKILPRSRTGDTFKTPSPYEQLMPLPTLPLNSFRRDSLMIRPPHFKYISLLSSHPIHHLCPPPIKFLIIQLNSQTLTKIQPSLGFFKRKICTLLRLGWGWGRIGPLSHCQVFAL